MISDLFVLFAVFFFIGRIVSDYFFPKIFSPNLLALPIGLTFLSLITSSLYLMGLSTKLISKIIIVLLIFSVIVRTKKIIKVKKYLTSPQNYLHFIIFIFFASLIAIELLSATHKTIFSWGNPWDFLSYLSASEAYRNFTFQEILDADSYTLATNPVIYFGNSNIFARPTFSIQNAVLSHLTDSNPFIEIYLFKSFLHVVLLSSLILLFKALLINFRFKFSWEYIFGGILVLGIWSYYSKDIEALSAQLALPILITSYAILFYFLQTSSTLTLEEKIKLLLLIISLMSSTVVVYPEMAFALFPGVVALITKITSIRSRRVIGHLAEIKNVVLITAVGAALLVNWKSSILFGFNQFNWSQENPDVSWWIPYNRFLYGDSNEIFDFFVNLQTGEVQKSFYDSLSIISFQQTTQIFLTLLPALLGFINFNPGNIDLNLSNSLATSMRFLVLVHFFICFIIISFSGLKRKISSVGFAFSSKSINFIFVTLSFFLIFFLFNSQLWQLGKYASWIMLIIIAIYLNQLIFYLTKVQNPFIKVVNFFGISLVLMAQSMFFVSHLNDEISVTEHVVFPTYPYVQQDVSDISKSKNMNINELIDRARGCRGVNERVQNPFVRQIAFISLARSGAEIHSELPVLAYFGWGPRLAATQPFIYSDSCKFNASFNDTDFYTFSLTKNN